MRRRNGRVSHLSRLLIRLAWTYSFLCRMDDESWKGASLVGVYALGADLTSFPMDRDLEVGQGVEKVSMRSVLNKIAAERLWIEKRLEELSPPRQESMIRATRTAEVEAPVTSPHHQSTTTSSTGASTLTNNTDGSSTPEILRRRPLRRCVVPVGSVDQLISSPVDAAWTRLSIYRALLDRLQDGLDSELRQRIPCNCSRVGKAAPQGGTNNFVPLLGESQSSCSRLPGLWFLTQRREERVDFIHHILPPSDLLDFCGCQEAMRGSWRGCRLCGWRWCLCGKNNHAERVLHLRVFVKAKTLQDFLRENFRDPIIEAWDGLDQSTRLGLSICLHERLWRTTCSGGVDAGAQFVSRRSATECKFGFAADREGAMKHLVRHISEYVDGPSDFLAQVLARWGHYDDFVELDYGLDHWTDPRSGARKGFFSSDEVRVREYLRLRQNCVSPCCEFRRFYHVWFFLLGALAGVLILMIIVQIIIRDRSRDSLSAK